MTTSELHARRVRLQRASLQQQRKTVCWPDQLDASRRPNSRKKNNKSAERATRAQLATAEIVEVLEVATSLARDFEDEAVGGGERKDDSAKGG